MYIHTGYHKNRILSIGIFDQLGADRFFINFCNTITFYSSNYNKLSNLECLFEMVIRISIPSIIQFAKRKFNFLIEI